MVNILWEYVFSFSIHEIEPELQIERTGAKRWGEKRGNSNRFSSFIFYQRVFCLLSLNNSKEFTRGSRIQEVFRIFGLIAVLLFFIAVAY